MRKNRSLYTAGTLVLCLATACGFFAAGTARVVTTCLLAAVGAYLCIHALRQECRFMSPKVGDKWLLQDGTVLTVLGASRGDSPVHERSDDGGNAVVNLRSFQQRLEDGGARLLP